MYPECSDDSDVIVMLVVETVTYCCDRGNGGSNSAGGADCGGELR